MSSSRRHRSINIWPGFVDALAAVLLVFVFMLVFFLMVQFYLSGVLTGQQDEIGQLKRSLIQLAETLSLEQDKSTNLQQSLADVENRLRATLADKEQLDLQLKSTSEQLALSEADLAAARRTITADKETIRLKLATIASLQQDIAALRTLRESLEADVADLSGRLDQSQTELGQVRDRSKQLEAQLAEETERTLLAQKEIVDRDVQIADLVGKIEEQDQALAEGRALTADQQARIDRLNKQLAAVRRQLQELNNLLATAEAKVASQKIEITDLGKRLNLALASKIRELNQYRSEFFGRMREILGDRQDIRIVGDRFVFQSEVLFASGSARLGDTGKQELAKVASALTEVIAQIPTDLDWVLRIDGHTDRVPINTERFPSNWELSTARSLAILRYLLDQGVPANHLLAAGFGDQRPLDTADTPQAWRKNRRIEMKFTLP